jgi:hypothetical protein
LIAVILADDDAAALTSETQDQLVARLPCYTAPSAALSFPENRLHAETKIASASGDHAEAVPACLMPALEKTDRRQFGRVRDDAAFDRRALQAGRWGRGAG